MAALSVSPPPASALEALAELALLVEAWGRRLNLSGHRTAEAVVRRLILDAAALDASLPERIGTLADVGSGAGFPGLPLAILHPERTVRLIEARERRHHFQRMAVRILGLKNVETFHGRAESLAPRPGDAGIAQGAARPPQAAALLLPWVRPGGWLIIPGSTRAPRLGDQPGVESQGIVRYRVPGGLARSFWLGKRQP
ncbi:MAG TPA: 16S rRNA (guanine(527)-N(7))-methyltransferase RsmG [Myxococcota bacterium]|nr:16S rRNA (guanine(527)-N(7))-methyltransferase RsmG [Myxococcota bacterium]